jgi:hypothetical protein
MIREAELYVRMVDAILCYTPVAAREHDDGTFHIIDSVDFDPEDTSTLLEFLPGDDVRATARNLGERFGLRLVATELVRTSVEERDYWRVLFLVALGEGPTGLSVDRIHAIAKRVKQESASGLRWHYPSVVDWAYSVT